jgi:hypothetical protein
MSMIQIRRNHVPRTICAVVAAFAVLSLAAPLRAQEKDSDFIDTRVTFVFADDNVFAGPRDRSPNIDFGQRNEANTFFDNYDTKDSGQETKSNLVLYKAFGGPFPRIVGDAALVSRFDFYLDEETGKPGAGFFDDGTFLQLSYLLCDTSGTPSELSKAKNRLYLLAFPFNADRMRLGYSYDITWGGNPTFPNNTRGVPGLKLGWDGDRAYAFVGAKSARLLNEKTNDLQSNFGLLAGAGYDLTDLLRWEVGGGFFQKGVFPPNSLTDPIGGKDVQAEGISSPSRRSSRGPEAPAPWRARSSDNRAIAGSSAPRATVRPAAIRCPPPLSKSPSAAAFCTAWPRSTPSTERAEPLPSAPSRPTTTAGLP